MKIYRWFLPFLIISCQVSQSDQLKDFIPGTYRANINQEYSTGHDTLFIKAINNFGNTYQLTRISSFIRKIDGVEYPLERKKKQWVVTYDSDKKVLNETAQSATISFNPDKRELYLGSRRYIKISNHNK